MAANDNGTGKLGEPIAVVGSGFRFPGSANSPSKLWELLKKPRDLLQGIPKSRFNIDNFYHPDPDHHGTTNVRESYFLDGDHRHFDANFFNHKPVEVSAIDPQQRMLLEVVYESIEAAGLKLESLAGSRTGVYVGLMCADYADLLNGDLNSLPTYSPTGIARSITSNRISYFFDWHGPSMTIDTACSSSMVAVHHAVQLLRSGDSDVAVAAGANMMLTPGQYAGCSSLHMLSADGRSRMWDASGTGYGRGEAVAAVVLKRLSSALADGDKIECVIRETGVNQDGRTKGITVPNPVAQIDLILDTYAKAGLDPKNPAERCQYFEAHGTGTAAGDPKEAEAISKAFFNPGEQIADNVDPLYVGSIKTVVGHTEGTAGIAGLLKASLALQHGILPPNLLFETLNPAIEPFYRNLELVTKAKPWPKLAAGIPRRASVNSFGFGGTNSHIIIENYVPPTESTNTTSLSRLLTPINFSAASEFSLRGILSDYAEYLEANPDVDIFNLSHTLHARRSEHAVRTSISAKSVADLKSKLDALLKEPSSGKPAPVGTRAKATKTPIRVLGVFTGQGAQWPTMGRELIKSSPYVRKVIEELDVVLQQLPEVARPTWSLMDQLTCDPSESRVAEAAFAQPLTTVIEVIVYDLLRSAGVKFQAIVGHSSGEIAAAYARGFITRDEAVKIAYLRGFAATAYPSEKPGSMMAAGTSGEDADELCNLPMFQGRLHVAAYNSPVGVTLSGDSDAIEEAKEVLEEEKKFARVLKVDKAYHSPHMKNSSTKFLELLAQCNIQPKHVDGDFPWFSSVFENTVVRGDMDGDHDLAGPYWASNMLRPVSFCQAVQNAVVQQGPFDAAIEVGPHAALKGPVMETLQENEAEKIPYFGLLHRGKDDVEALSDALGSLWSHFSATGLDLKSFDQLATGNAPRELIKGLPTYRWDHQRPYYHETRISKAYYSAPNPHNPLLGVRTSDPMQEEIRWRNMLKMSELPWVRGHQLQSQVLYPATAYISTAVEAAQALVPDQKVALIEIQDFTLGKPIVFDESDPGIETLFTLRDIVKLSNETTSAAFTYHASANAGSEVLSTHATGRLLVTTGETSSQWLPPRKKDPPGLDSVTEDRFYSSLEAIGYEYNGLFKSLSDIERRMNFSSSKITNPPNEDDSQEMLIHPALLDTALQSVFLAYSWPGDGSFDALHVPTGIKSFRMNVGLCKQYLLPEARVASCSHLTVDPMVTREIRGDVDIYANDGSGLVQMEGIKVVPVVEHTAAEDKKMFSEHRWGVLVPDCEVAMGGHRATAEDYELSEAMERVCIDYMRQALAHFPEEGRKSLNLEWHFECLLAYFSDVVSRTQAGTKQFFKKQWLNDTADDIAALKAKFHDKTEMQLACVVGDQLPAVIRGETSIIEHMFKDGLLERWYQLGVGLKEVSQSLGQTVKQIVTRHAHMNILEIGAGTGGATRVIMRDIGRSFASYTFTDISNGFFGPAEDLFSAQSDKMVFKLLDVEKDIAEQGYQEHSYDLIVASLVLHATTNLRRTLTHARRLLKPGGYLVMQEVTNNEVCRVGFIMSATPGWWLGQDDGRKFSPCVSTMEWHKLLLETGFSGVDTNTPENDELAFPLGVIVSQAVDDRISMLREPLSWPSIEEENQGLDLVIIGGTNLESKRAIDQLARLVRQSGATYSVVKTLGDICDTDLSPTSSILCLTELDEPVFKNVTERALQGMQKIFEGERTVLWITRGSRAENPFMNISVGLGRSVILENASLALQFLDLEVGTKPDARELLESFLRLYYGTQWEKQGHFDNMLWTNEQEIAIEDGRQVVSRVYHSTTINNRYNASRRTIYEPMDPKAVPLDLSLSAPKPTLELDGLLQAQMLERNTTTSNSDVLVNVSHSLWLPSLSSAPESLNLVVGTVKASNRSVVAISDKNGSYALVPADKVLDVELPEGKEVEFLSQMEKQIRLDSVLSVCHEHSILLVHEPSAEFAANLVEHAAEKGVVVSFTTSSSQVDSSWTVITPHSQIREIRSAIPSHTSTFIDCSETAAQQGRPDPLISLSLPESCIRLTLAQAQALPHTRHSAAVAIRQNLQDFVTRALGSTQTDSSILPTITYEQVVAGSAIDHTRPAVVSWASFASSVPVQAATVNSHVSFKGDRTYVLFGLTSDMAQSICDWMASHGARNIVLTSRTPRLNAEWLELKVKAGIRIEAFSNDITDKVALTTLVGHIRQNFPPIAGVAHGAMVLDDISFFDMPFEKLTKVLGPKVTGADNLNEIFQENDLDWFILFSSVVAVAGNRGQAAYSAGNMFLTALAEQRRKKGLAASIFHIGAVMGVGYINRVFSEMLYQTVQKAGVLLASEREVHLCFGEAVLASDPNSGRNPELITALKTYRPKEIVARWPQFPRFQHLFQDDEEGNKVTSERAAAVSVKAKLAEATSAEEVQQFVQDAFVQKLQGLLHIPEDRLAAEILSSGTDDLGIDSLIAVEIRSWFAKEIEVDVPVFKILAGGSVQQLLEHAVENIPASLIQNQGNSTPASDAKPEVAAPKTLDSASSSDPTSSAVSSRLDEDEEDIPSATSMSVTSSDEVSKPKYQKILPLSPGQSRFWFQKDLLADQTTANNTISVSITGAVRLESFEKAVHTVAARHEALRTSFFMDGDKPVQAISQTSRLHLERVTLASESELAQEFEKLKKHTYDIEHGEVMRIIFLGVTPTKNFVLIGSHHIVIDGISLEVFLDDLQRAYNRQPLSGSVYQYSAYTQTMLNDLSSGKMKGDVTYWKEEFETPPAPLPLIPFSSARSRTTLNSYGHTSMSRIIEKDLAKEIAETCRRLSANIFHFHLGVLEVLLFKLFNTGDVCIGMADANRMDKQVANSIGMYLNLLPLRFNLTEQQTFEKVLKETRRKAYLAMSHSRLPFDFLLNNINLDRSAATTPLFQAFINYRQGVSENRQFGEAAVETLEMSLPRSGYDISLDIIENPGSDTRVTLMLQQSLYSSDDANRLLDMYFKLLTEFSRSCGQMLRQVSLVSSQEVSNAIRLGKGPTLTSEWPETLIHRINETIVKHPEKISIKDGSNKSWTYQELDAKATQISAALLNVNVTPGSKVAVFQENSAYFISSLLAVWRIGGIYVPLDRNIPSARLGVMITACKPQAILVDSKSIVESDNLGLSPTVTVLNVHDSLEGKSAARAVLPKASDVAAVMFTSGSTGVPKGVVLSHSSLCNHVEALCHTHGFGAEVVLQQSSVGFDMSLNQIFMALSNGGTLVIVPEALRKDPVAVTKIMLDHDITYTSATPSEYLAWMKHGAENISQSKHWRFATAGGEQYPQELLKAFRKFKTEVSESFRVFNAYGPTECSMSSTEAELSLDSANQSITAGKALPNYSVYIMNENMSILPVGWAGQICVAGAGVAVEYLNNQADTRAKFTTDPNPSSYSTQRGWNRMYLTGDKGILRPDGTLEILGRIEGDTQIKLRGLRIELQDVEHSIIVAAKGKVREVAVTPRGNPTVLVAHAVLSAGVSEEGDFLRSLAASLPIPQYMRPAAIISVPSMPLTSSGKIDRRALQSLAVPDSSLGVVSVKAGELTETESKLAEIWREVLPEHLRAINTIGEDSDFFHCGGNSMLLLELRQLVNKKFAVNLPLIQLFENSTLSGMAATVNGSSLSDSIVDWEVETKIPEDFQVQAGGETRVASRSDQKVVVLTGSTGFLGLQLLRLLIKDPNVAKIYCIAIRDGKKLGSLSESPKVIQQIGDLSLPRCGLSQEDAEAIFSEADVVLHNGADVSFLKTYNSLKAPNFGSTKELVKLALPRLIPVHFVSTATVGRFNGSDELAPESVANFKPEASIADGYASSKWASEVFLEKANQQLGLPVTIHRPSAIVGDEAGDDIISNVLEYGSILKALPDSSRWKGFVDLVSLDHAAGGIVLSALKEKKSVDGVEYLHHAGDQVIPVQQIKALFHGDGGIQIGSWPMDKWVTEAVQNGMDPLVGEFLLNADQGQGLQVGQKLLLQGK
nr:putative polyketide synthase-nonribosomal peptide synthetase hybrid [Trichoderma sp. BCC7579]